MVHLGLGGVRCDLHWLRWWKKWFIQHSLSGVGSVHLGWGGVRCGSS